MADNGEEKLIAVARHIAKTLGHTNSMTDDVLHIFSTFDRRISRDKLASTEDMTTTAAAAINPESLLRSIDHRLSPLISSDTPIWSESAAEAASFLSAVDDLLGAIREWGPLSDEDRSILPYLDRAEDLLQQAMFRLESEFRSLLIEHPGGSGGLVNESIRSDYGGGYTSLSEDDDDDDELIPVARPLTNYNVIIDALPAGTIGDLHEIATRMVMSDYARECSHIYSACRRDFVEESLSRLGLQQKLPLTIEENQNIPWSDLDGEIEHWTKAAAPVALRILFPSERRLCERVFAGFPSAIDLSFMKVCRGPTLQLLGFADAVAMSSRSPERLFRVLDVYETLGDLIPEFEVLFSTPYCVALKTEAVAIWKRLGECIRGIFMELENLIRRDPAKQAMPGGSVHPITRYVINYVRAACKSRGTLEQVFEDYLSSTSLGVQIAWIMELLETNLETKSKLYGDDLGLSSIFMMNNGRYIVQKVRDNELGELLGEDWVRKQNAKVKQFYVNYQRTSWNKVVGVLKQVDDDGAAASNNNDSSLVVRSSMKERMKLFNTYFEETCKAQSTWVVFDEEVKQELKISVASNLSPAYRNFVGRFQDLGNMDKYVKYSVEQIEAKIHNELFQGTRK